MKMKETNTNAVWWMGAGEGRGTIAVEHTGVGYGEGVVVGWLDPERASRVKKWFLVKSACTAA